MKTISFISLLFLATIISCDTNEEPKPVNQDPPGIELNFDNQTIDKTAIDSVIFKYEENNQQVTKKVEIVDGQFIISFSQNIPKGQINIYTTEGNIHKLYIHEISDQSSLGIQLSAPSGDFDPNWMTRLIFYYQKNHVEIGLSPQDPYVSVSVIPEFFQFMYLSKEIFLRTSSTTQTIGIGSMEEPDVSSFTDAVSFADLAEIGNYWNEVEIYVSLLKNDNQEITFFYKGVK